MSTTPPGPDFREIWWRVGLNPDDLLGYVKSESSRKRRLLACACARRVMDRMPDEFIRSAVSLSEAYADGLASEEELLAARRAVSTEVHGAVIRHPRGTPLGVAIDTLSGTLAGLIGCVAYAIPQQKAELDIHCALIRDVFGNPFRPVVFNESWHTDTAETLARQMYESRDFGAMPILADALQDAGCDNEDLLNHCRNTKQVHVRGCWVVDLVLGKT